MRGWIPVRYKGMLFFQEKLSKSFLDRTTESGLIFTPFKNSIILLLLVFRIGIKEGLQQPNLMNYWQVGEQWEKRHTHPANQGLKEKKALWTGDWKKVWLIFNLDGKPASLSRHCHSLSSVYISHEEATLRASALEHRRQSLLRVFVSLHGQDFLSEDCQHPGWKDE